ncbi:protein enhancer of sevenless 2B-like [Galendromus occidentalis]|uniref:Protein enhancer of sevenless 2B-like n=1 Tax=Galendromus occidentalis TaxID=34638 RepID=A0AAJ6QNG8_9ACAR|nr:protein enhancer of sevenless 2B-like [Galendromus occidentalis]
MEAVAKYDFTASKKDELSFKKTKVLKVLNKEDDPNWFLVESEGEKGLVPATYLEMKNHDWYYGRLRRLDAEKLLGGKHLGAFLIRLSETQPEEFSLSVKCEDKVRHFKVLRGAPGMFNIWDIKFPSLNELIDYHRRNEAERMVKLKDMHPDDRLLRAKFDYTPKQGDELKFRAGDIILAVDRSDSDWWEGEIGHAKGKFPARYLSPYREQPSTYNSELAGIASKAPL